MSLMFPETSVDQKVLEDLDFDLDVRAESDGEAVPTFRSWSLCTPGCTSQNTGSGCSFCC